LDLVAQAGLSEIAGKRVLDFGYGLIGAPRLLASLGADVTGVDINPDLHAAYSFPGDQGPMSADKTRPQGLPGHLRLVLGRFPAEPLVRAAVGTGYDLIIAKNVLKNGYIHPEKPVEKPRHKFLLGVSDEDFVRTLALILNPYGRIIIYNLTPAPAKDDQPYKPWADGRCPFSEALFQRHGLRVVPPGLDRPDSPFVRQMGKLMGWDQPDPRPPHDKGMDLENDLFASFTIIEKP
jgi:SAM-dependent methyltransferase